MSSLRIGIDARLGHRHGVGRYITEVIAGVAACGSRHEYVVLVKPEAVDTLRRRVGDPPNIRWVPVPGAPFRLTEQVELVRALRRERLDLLHVMFDYGMPIVPPCPFVLTVHDAWFESRTFFRSEWTRRYFQFMTRRGIRRAARVMTVSGFVRRKILDHCPWVRPEEAKIRVVPNGVGAEFTPGPARPPACLASRGVSAYLLYVGVLARNKNVVGLLEAYAKLVSRRPDAPPLVLGGARDPSFPDPAALAERLAIRPRVHVLGYVPEAELADLYRGASLFAFPSLHEGFGIPVLEAMACGVPVVASNTTAIPEVAGDAAVLVDPEKPEAIAAAMARVLDDAELRRLLIERGIRRSRALSWPRTARQVADIYAECGEG